MIEDFNGPLQGAFAWTSLEHEVSLPRRNERFLKSKLGEACGSAGKIRTDGNYQISMQPPPMIYPLPNNQSTCFAAHRSKSHSYKVESNCCLHLHRREKKVSFLLRPESTVPLTLSNVDEIVQKMSILIGKELRIDLNKTLGWTG